MFVVRYRVYLNNICSGFGSVLAFIRDECYAINCDSPNADGYPKKMWKY